MHVQVLYRFLEFFSNFDWERFCLSLWGPVPISSLPDMTGNLYVPLCFDRSVIEFVIIHVMSCSGTSAEG